MSCREDQSKLSAWLDSELSAAEARDVEAHVTRCAACRELVSELREVKALVVSAVSELEPDPFFVARFRARRDELATAPWWTWRRLALTFLPLAAAALVAALLSVRGSGEGNDIHALELAALDGPPPATLEGGEPVLSIALAPFPASDR
jgi:anti-sigma factor RsiW